MLMVKPGLLYLDIVKQTKEEFPEYPLFVYQVNNLKFHAKNVHVRILLQIYSCVGIR